MTDPETTILCQCLEKQIAEFDMISSIFCNPGEFQVDDPSIAADINEFLTNSQSTHLLGRNLDYLICLRHPATGKVDVKIELPNYYPTVERPIITVRAACFNRHQEMEIKRQIEEFIDNEVLDKEESYAYAIVSWIQENLESFLPVPGHLVVADGPGVVPFERLWIYSHHIKSKTKRQTIVQTARDLKLSGFMKPGKPGIICVEGLRENTQEFWKIIRQLKWQKVGIRIVEEKKKRIEELSKFRRFPAFREEIFTDLANDGDGEDSDDVTGGGEAVKMDMSVFMKFLQKYNSLYVRKELFGFD